MGAESGDVQRELEALRARVRELEATEQRLRDVFETLELIVIALDLDADITYANPFTERLSGWTNEELQGKNWFEQFRSGRGSFVSRVRDGEFPSHDQSTIIVRNGDRHQVDWYNVPLRDGSGAVTGILGIGRDMTAERAAQRSLEVAERRMMDVLETVDLIAGQVDLEGRLTYVNEYLIRLSGWTRDELIGRPYIEAFGSGDDEFMKLVRQGTFPPHDRGAIVLRSGERREIEWANVGLYNNQGVLTGVVGIGRDVTDQLRAEREAHQLVAEHEALERVATAVARGLDSDVVFRMVAEEAGRLVGSRRLHAAPVRAGRAGDDRRQLGRRRRRRGASAGRAGADRCGARDGGRADQRPSRALRRAGDRRPHPGGRRGADPRHGQHLGHAGRLAAGRGPADGGHRAAAGRVRVAGRHGGLERRRSHGAGGVAQADHGGRGRGPAAARAEPARRCAAAVRVAVAGAADDARPAPPRPGRRGGRSSAPPSRS